LRLEAHELRDYIRKLESQLELDVIEEIRADMALQRANWSDN
jgi:hypothetical protein